MITMNVHDVRHIILANPVEMGKSSIPPQPFWTRKLRVETAGGDVFELTIFSDDRSDLLTASEREAATVEV